MTQYALGCAFNVPDLFDNFNFKKLKITCKKCVQLIGDRHRDILACQIFRECFYLVLKDVINRNVTFWLPLNGIRKCSIHMKRVTGESFKKLRQSGKWQNVDFLTSFFSGYEIGFYMLGQRTPREKIIYVGNDLKQIITENTNKGIQYGDGCIDTKLSDYLPQMYEIYPEVPESDIKKILTFAWKAVYLHNSYGGDVMIRNQKFFSYIGTLKKNPLLHFSYYKRKLITKIRVKYRRKGSPWDNYYYFAVTQEQYEDYLRQKKQVGRPRKYFTFKNIYLYQIKDECELTESAKCYIFRVKYQTFIKLKFFVKELVKEVELVKVRSPLKFKDVLVNDNKYDYI